MKILLGSDGSADARAALSLVAGWRPRADDLITVLAVVPSLPVLGAELEPPDPAHAPSLVDAATMIVDDAAAQLGAAGHRVRTMVRLGKPPEEILAVADEIGSDLIVLGAKGVGRVRLCPAPVPAPNCGHIQSGFVSTHGFTMRFRNWVRCNSLPYNVSRKTTSRCFALS